MPQVQEKQSGRIFEYFIVPTVPPGNPPAWAAGFKPMNTNGNVLRIDHDRLAYPGNYLVLHVKRTYICTKDDIARDYTILS